MDKERVFIVGVDDGSISYFEHFMEELEGLVEAAEGQYISSIIQRIKKTSPSTVIGSGKLKEIVLYLEELEIDTVVFSCELTGSQLRNIEDVMNVKVLDRTMLILDIFAKRATSREGKLQVHLAQLEYRLPRLVGMRSSLSRLGGGIGTRGPGEQKLETDRRHIQKEIDRIKGRLKEVEKHRRVQRQNREKSDISQVAIVGYTNAGKSTIINGLLKYNNQDDRQVFAKDMVFATLEPSLRRVVLPNGTPVIMADTVGFVTNLPTALVEAFKATLDEIKEADLILHILDGSDDELENQMETTMGILRDLDVLNIPRITVLNKVDKLRDEALLLAIDFKPIECCAFNEEDIKRLAETVEAELSIAHEFVSLMIPYEEGNILDELLKSGRFKVVSHKEKGTHIEGNLRTGEKEKYSSYLLEGYHEN
ncbi:MAG: GTPase HflX [Tissierellia bacterium]|nr:GTPase HflX [Tissierellia bacterium]